MNEYFAHTLAQVLEETSTNMGNAMILDHLAKKGTVTIEEAEFFHNLCADIITEAAEDFIPDTLEVPDAPEASAPIELYDAVGNKYIFQDGSLIPADEETDPDGLEAEEAPEEVEPEMAPEVEPEMAPEVAPEEEYAESTEAEGEVVEDNEGEGEVVEESTQVLEESDNVVARILANLRH